MRSNTVKALASIAALLGITAGTLSASGTAVAATPERHQSVVSGPAAVTEVENLGLNTSQAKRVQSYLRYYAGVYSGAIDGLLGTETIKALQRFLRSAGYYSGAVDGIAGAGTRAGFAAWANQLPMD
ncbi:peptidoglycan-binding protein [Streptomyces sp. NPDC002476]